MSESVKKKYTDLHDQDQVRYDGQIKELKDNGFFMTEDGKKSTDLPPPKVKMSKKDKAKIKAHTEKVIAEQKVDKEKEKAKAEKQKARD